MKSKLIIKLGNSVSYKGKKYRVFGISKSGVCLLDDDNNDVSLTLKEVEDKLDKKEIVVV